MSEPSATPATPPVSDSAATQALIREITAEARSSGKSLVDDPDAPASAGDADASEEGGANEESSPKNGKPKEELRDSDGDGDPESEEQGAEDREELAAAPGEINVEALKAALTAEGGVDMVKLAESLGVEPEKLGVSPGFAKAMRIERRKTQQTLERANALAQKLEKEYGGQVRARKAAATGDLQPAIEFVESTFGMGWNELNKMVGQLLQGKPIADLEQKREFRELKKREQERAEAAKKEADAAAAKTKVEDAKQWIRGQLKTEKLASPELDAQLKAAGFPSVIDLVFEEMRDNYSKGLTDPKKALERVKVKLAKQAKALSAVGVAPKTTPTPKKDAVSSSKPRAGAQAGAAGNGRPMTDKELREAVLKEAGLYR